MSKILLIITTLLSTFSLSCNYILGVENLGDGYYLDTDQVIYTEGLDYEGSGICVIPPVVKSVKSNDDFIIVHSLLDNNEAYWIIKKNEKKVLTGEEFKKDSTKVNYYFYHYYKYSNTIGPLDSTSFKKKLFSDRINLQFNK